MDPSTVSPMIGGLQSEVLCISWHAKLGFVSEGSDFSVGQAGIVLAVNVQAIPHGLVQKAVRIYSCGLRLWDLVVPRVKDCFGHWFSGKVRLPDSSGSSNKTVPGPPKSVDAEWVSGFRHLWNEHNILYCTIHIYMLYSY